MATEARVRSLDALESFRSSLIVFLTKARSGVEQITDELRRTREWVMTDRRLFWTEQCRKRTRQLEQAKSELLTARCSNVLENLAVYQLQVKKAQLALDVATEKLENVKRWTRDFDRAVEPLLRRVESLRHHLQQTLPEGVTHLGQLIRLLEMYAETGAPVTAAQVSPAGHDTRAAAPPPAPVDSPGTGQPTAQP